MTIKAYVLDALEKFWAKVSTYINALAGRVAALEDANTMESAQFSFFGVDTNVYKVGKIVVVQFFGSPQVEFTAQSQTTVGTLPAGFRPAFRVASNVFTNDAGAPRYQITFNTSGEITIYNHETTTHQANKGFVRDFWVFIAA